MGGGAVGVVLVRWLGGGPGRGEGGGLAAAGSADLDLRQHRAHTSAAIRATRTTPPPTAMPMIAAVERVGDGEEAEDRDSSIGVVLLVGEFEDVDEGEGKIVAMDEVLGVTVGVEELEGVLEGVREMEGVIDGVEDPSHKSPELHTVVGLPHSTDPLKPEKVAEVPPLVHVAVAPEFVMRV